VTEQYRGNRKHRHSVGILVLSYFFSYPERRNTRWKLMSRIFRLNIPVKILFPRPDKHLRNDPKFTLQIRGETHKDILSNMSIILFQISQKWEPLGQISRKFFYLSSNCYLRKDRQTDRHGQTNRYFIQILTYTTAKNKNCQSLPFQKHPLHISLEVTTNGTDCIHLRLI
jgi:hypothetical protein